MRLKPILAVAAVIVALPLLMWACVVVTNQPTRYIQALDDLAIPDTWQLAHTTIDAPGGLGDCALIFGNCPVVVRYYLVDAEPEETFAALSLIAPAAGFAIEDTYNIGCRVPRTGSTACLLAARRGDIRDADSVQLWIVFYDRGGLASYDPDGSVGGDPDRSLIVISARHS